MKKIVLVIFLLVTTLELFAQTYTSKNNRTQSWSDNNSWVGGVAPNPALTATTAIYGKVTQTGNLSVSNNGVATITVYDTLNITGSVSNNRIFTIQAGGIVTVDGSYVNENTSSTLDIYGTLIIKGNLTPYSTVRVRPGGLLIVLGDLTVPNTAPSIINEGQTVVVGEVAIQGGSITTGNQFYIFDDTPTYSNNSPSVDGVTYNGSNGSALTSEFPTESSIPPPLQTILDGLGVSCGGYNSISGSYVCSGSPSAVITGSNITGASYSWERSTTSATTGFTIIGGATSKDYSPGVLAQTTWYRRTVTKSSPACTNVSATIQLMTFGSMWTGATNTDLANAGNWCGGVPTAATNVLIPSGLNSWQYPTSGSMVANNLTILSGASLNINDNQTVTVNGNLSNSGTITAAWTNPSLNLYGNFTNTGTLTFNSSTAGTIRFQGSTQQTVTGGSYTFPNMVVASGTNQVVFSSSVNVNGTFTFTSGIINMSGMTLTLGTSTSSTGTLTYTAGRIANGTFTRYVASGAQTVFRFPMGTTAYNRPFYFTTTANITTGGTMSVTHTGATTTTTGLSIADGGTIQNRQNSYWTVTTNTLAGGTYNVFAGGTGFGTVGNTTHLRLMRAASIIPAPSTHVNASGSNTDFLAQRNTVSLADLTGGALYIGSINPSSSPLPVKLISFTANPQTNGIQLKWLTSKEENFDYFLLERAGTDLNFQPIATIQGNGGLDITASYNHLDDAPLNGKNYYRLKSVDLDQTFEYSNVIVAEWNFETQKNDVSVYPNPIVDRSFTLEINHEISSATSLTLLNSLGKEIIQQQVASNKEVITLQDDLKPGIYYIKITGTDFSKTIKVFIQ